MSSANRHFQRSAQPIQHHHHQLYTNGYPMGYNSNYHPVGNNQANGFYSRPVYAPGAGNNNNAASINHPAVMNTTSNGFARGLNVNAPVFTPRYLPQQQQQQQAVNNISAAQSYGTASPYSTYMNVQPAPRPQQQHQFFNHPQQQQAAAYDPSTRTQYLQQIYSAPHQSSAISLQSSSHSPVQHQQQQVAAPKYHPAAAAMSQGSQAYGSAAVAGMMSAAYDQSALGAQADDYGGQFAQFPISNELADAIQNSRNRMAITEVQIGLEQLVADVHEYELWANAIKARMSSGFSADDAQIIAWLIVEMSYLGTSAQYNFSRLCKLIDTEVKHFTTKYVIPRIAHFMVLGVEKLPPEQLANFCCFLAELYDKTEVNGVRVSRLGQYLVDQIGVLLKSDQLNDQIVKSICASLKLCGRYIEDDQDPAVLNTLFEEMEKLQSCSKISSAVKNNIRQLKQLREREWGITKEEFTNGSMTGSWYQAGQPAEGIMYGPDGVPISEEERLFLEESCRAIDSNYTSNAIDDDALNDYENFLREQTESTAISTAEKALQSLSVDEDDLAQNQQRANTNA